MGHDIWALNAQQRRQCRASLCILYTQRNLYINQVKPLRVPEDIVAGKYGKPSVSNARHTRTALSKFFKWCAQAGRKYVKASPCVNLAPLDPEVARKRVLSADEIRTLW